MSLVLKIGGHLFHREEINHKFIEAVADVVRETFSRSDKWVIVVGGGDGARRFIEAARRLGADETLCDEIAIQVTRIHAALFIEALKDIAYPSVPKNIPELKEALAISNLAIVGGFWPGQSTFAVASLCAQAIKASRLIVATDVEGVYDSDPKINPNAKLIPKMTYSDLQRMLAATSHRAGEYRLIDSVGLSMLERSSTKLLFVDGRNVENIKHAILYGKAGTVIEP
ncbi:MAG: UMP kinase [Nitrososphaerota archaeon]